MLSNISLRRKMIIPVMITLILTYLCFILFGYVSVIKTEKENLLTRTHVLAEGVSINLKAAMIFDDELSGREILAAFRAEPWVTDVKVVKTGGVLFAEYENTLAKNSNIKIENYKKLNTFTSDYEYCKNFLRVSLPITIGGKLYANMLIKVSLESVKQTKSDLFSFSLVLLAPLIVSCLVLVRQLESWVVGPILRLSQVMQDIVINQKSKERPKAIANDEVSTLVNCFNEMMDSLDERDRHIQKALDQLAHEKMFADDVISTVKHGLLVLDHNGVVIMANEACHALFPAVKGSLSRQYFASAICPKIWQSCELWLKAGDESTLQLEAVIDGVECNGTERVFLVNARTLQKRNEVLLVLDDITEKHIATQQQQLAARMFEQSRDGIVVVDSEDKIKMINPALCGMMKRHFDGILEQPIGNLFEARQFAAIRNLLQGGRRHWKGELIEKCSDGTAIPLAVSAILIGDDAESKVVINVSDLTDEKEIKRLDYLAHHDGLTGLANRTQLYSVLGDLINTYCSTQQSFAVLYIDLDGFKPVNDTYGHHVGDYVLKEVATRFRGLIRQQDFVARLAGDEFVILLNPVNSYEVGYAIAERIRRKIAEPIVHEESEICLGSSIGYTIIQGGNGLSIESVLAQADSAMYKAKQTNNKGIYFTS